jgi:hypothetical protein
LRVDSYAEDSKRHVTEGSRNEALLFIELHKGNLKALGKGRLGQYVYVARTCT